MNTEQPQIINTRGDILLEAHKVINGERQDTYGSPEDSFQLIASYWSIYLGLDDPLTPKDVAMMMGLLKLARAQNKGYNEDDYIDYAGYIGIADTLARGEENAR